MLFFKQLTPDVQQKHFQYISNSISQIMMKNSSKVYMAIIHDYVYTLCRHQKQEKLLNLIYSILQKIIPENLSGISIQSKNILLQTANLIQETEKNLEKVQDACVYLDVNYCTADLNIKLIQKLNHIFLQEFFKKQQLLEVLGKTIAREHFAGKQQNIKAVLKAIKTIDNKEKYFSKHFIKYYLPLLSQHYEELSKEKFTEFNNSDVIAKYISFAQQEIIKQTEFLNNFWTQKDCIQDKNFLLRQLYEILVSQYKNQIYEKHKQKLFSQLTLQLLELFKYGKNDDIQKHANWYNQVIKQKLQSYDTTHNSQFIDKICEFFMKIIGILQNTNKKFDIHYRSRFAFEEWINIERIQIPLRLNQYIKIQCKNNNVDQNDDEFLQRITIIFRLMKQKNAFQKHYRRELINRMLSGLNNFNKNRQMKIIHLMEKQCSEQFIKNIQPIMDDFQIGKFNHENQLNVLLLNSQNWPYDEKNKSIEIHSKLAVLTENYTQIFKKNNQAKSIYWHPIVGIVKINISFIKSKWNGQLTLNLCMATILLYFQKNNSSYQLKNFCCETGYKLDDIYESVNCLLSAKIINNEGSEDNYKLSLNQQFTYESKSFNLLTIQNQKQFQAKHLQELKADRKLMVEAIIVKIMKKARTSDYKKILEEAAPLIQKRGFNFNAKFVQSAIQRLIQKQFIRDFENGNLGYIA